MSNVERTEWRDEFPSRIRRQFANDKCYSQDIDMLEYRFIQGKLKIVGVFEYKEASARDKFDRDPNYCRAQKTLIPLLAEKLDCLGAFIFYNEAERLKDSRLEVRVVYPQEATHYFNVSQFRDFIRELGQPKYVPRYVQQLREIEREQELRKSSDQIV